MGVSLPDQGTGEAVKVVSPEHPSWTEERRVLGRTVYEIAHSATGVPRLG
ncbi:hypothetical protein [Alloactinosynnema sp. L-07]|nr:hypothetical protein [Alloactinosynnema sp. L-07]